MAAVHGWSLSVLVTQLCARVPGGTARYTAGLVAALRDSRRGDAELVAVTAARPCAAVSDLEVPSRALALSDRMLARTWERGLPPRPARGGVVHAPTLLVPPSSHRYRLVVTVHDVVPWTHPQTLTPRGVAFHRRMGARAARDADLIVTPSRAVAEQVRDILGPRCPVEAYAPGAAALTSGPDALRDREALGATGDYVLFVGTAEPRKRLDVLVRAMARPDCADLRLVVAGPPGWGEVNVGELAKRAGLRGRVVVTGRTTDQELAALYEGAAVVAMPSLAEGFGLPVLEAMGAGVPVVTSDDAALVEVGSGATLVVPVDDVDALAAALARAASDVALRAQLADRGRRRAASFSWRTTAEALWRRYRTLVSE